MGAQIWNAAAVAISAVIASVLLVLLSPPGGEAAEFLVWLVFFGASFWLLDRVATRRSRPPPRA
jgi:membrane protein implicated in regulation of membrane protease activity